jgi:hypothetical protein
MSTRDSYDTVAASYRHLVASELPGKVFDRAMLSAFSELVLASGSGPVAELTRAPDSREKVSQCHLIARRTISHPAL